VRASAGARPATPGTGSSTPKPSPTPRTGFSARSTTAGRTRTANTSPRPGRATLESTSYTPLDPEAVEALAGVAGVQAGDLGTGSRVTFGSTVAIGSFERGAVEGLVRSEGNPVAERDYRGLTLFEGVEGEAAGGPPGRAVTGLRAGGLGLTVDGERAELRLVGLYEDAAATESADVVALVEEAVSDAGASDSGAVERVDATHEGDAVVVTVEGETRSPLEGARSRRRDRRRRPTAVGPHRRT
jgi:hypothetical protein